MNYWLDWRFIGYNAQLREPMLITFIRTCTTFCNKSGGEVWGGGSAPSPEYKHKIHNVYLTTPWVTN